MIYEERRIILKRSALPAFQAWHRTAYAPTLAAGARVLCLLGGLIGNPVEELLRITRFPDVTTWERTQNLTGLQGASALVEREEVRLLRAISARPKPHLPGADHRSVYGYRRFFVKPSDLDEFIHCSADGIWPRIEAQGACILGLWTTVAAADPREVVLLTGYQSPSHWDATRTYQPKPSDMPQELWDNGNRLLARRNELTLRSWVCLMRALELENVNG